MSNIKEIVQVIESRGPEPMCTMLRVVTFSGTQNLAYADNAKAREAYDALSAAWLAHEERRNDAPNHLRVADDAGEVTLQMSDIHMVRIVNGAVWRAVVEAGLPKEEAAPEAVPA